MKKFIGHWLLNAASLLIIGNFTAAVTFSDTMALLFTSLALTILNMTIKPVLKVVSFPLTFLTFGLFSLIINGAVLYAAFALSEGSSIASFGSAVWIAVVLAIVNSLIEGLFDKDK